MRLIALLACVFLTHCLPIARSEDTNDAISLHAKAHQDPRTVAEIKRDNALIRAAARGDLVKVHRALDNGASVNARYIPEQVYPYSDTQYTALMRASRSGHAEVVKLLIASEADLDARREGQTSLYMAVMANQNEIVKLLVAAGAKGDPRQMRLTDELIRAACRGFKSSDGKVKQGPAIADVLARGAEVNSADPQGFTPLMYAANLGLLENVKQLLAAGADATLKSDLGDTALSLAERSTSGSPQARRQIVELLRTALSR